MFRCLRLEGPLRLLCTMICPNPYRQSADTPPAEHIMVDPGIGFGKQAEHNLEILRHLDAFKSALGHPVLLGTSHKSFIGRVLGDVPPHERVEGTAATVAVAIMKGVDIVRVHDVKQMVRVARMTDAI